MSHHHSNCEYHLRSDGIHEFVFKADERASIDAWVHILEQIQLAGQWYGKPQVTLLLDARHASHLPIRYLFECLSDYNRAYPSLKPPAVVIGYVHSPTAVILSIYYTLAELMAQPTTIQFFTEKGEALDWLIQHR